MGERRTVLILLWILCFSLISSSEILLVKSESNSMVTVNDEHFVIQEFFGGFHGSFLVGSFNATNGYWIKLDLSSSGNDVYLVHLNVFSANHGIIFSAKSKNFSETIYLDYEDVYNITIAKSPFYTDVWINGMIDVFHQETEQSSSENWVEVTRFTGSGSEILTTDYFTCDHVEWRIRWEYIPNPQFSNVSSFSAITYPQGENFWYTDAILNIGAEDTNGTSYVYDGNGTFYLKINVGWTESYIIIVEQNLESIPEFPSWIILPLFLVVTVSVIVFKKKLFNQRT